MKEEYTKRFVGKYCKIVIKEPGEQKVHTIIGVITEIDNKAGFLIIETEQGTAVLSIQTIIAIKPRQRQSP
jgi:ribosome maturation factor RimP